MNILLVNYEYKGQGGGAGQQTYYLARALRDLGHEVSLLIGWDDRLGQPEILEGVATHTVKYRRKNIQLSTALGLLSFSLRGVFHINSLTRNYHYDLIQFYFCVPTGILKYGIHGNTPYVISLRGMDIPGLRHNREKRLARMTAFLNKNIALKAAAVTCNSAESALTYARFIPDIKAAVIPNAVDYSVFAVKQSYADQISRFVTVARLISWKRLDLLIDAMVALHEKYPFIGLDIYGQGYLFDSLQNRISENQATEYIALKGFAEKPQLAEVLCEYDMFVLASTGESSPNVLLEAMSCGLPVVAAAAGGTLDVVEEGITGVLFKPNDLADTIEKLEYCLAHPEKMQEFGLSGRKRVEETYSIMNMAEQHLGLFERIVGQGRDK